MAKKPRIIAIQASQPDDPITPHSATTSRSENTAVETPTTPLPVTSGPWEQDIDPFEDIEKPLPGWPLVSKLIGKYPDLEAFKAFRVLNIKSLLYYQAELIDLQKDLHQAEYKEFRQGDNDGITDASLMAENLGYYLLNARMEKPNSKQVQLMKEIRVVLKDYNDALLKYSQITALPKADPYNVETLRVWLRTVGNFCIIGDAACVWGDYTKKKVQEKAIKWQFVDLLRNIFWPPPPQTNTSDLIVPRQGHKVDGLTRWVANEFVPFWHNVKKALWHEKKEAIPSESSLPTTEPVSQTSIEKTKTNISFRFWVSRKRNSDGTPEAISKQKERSDFTVYSEARMLRFTSAVATVIACLLPTVAIAVLSKVQTNKELLGLIAAFTAIFAMGLMALTEAGTSRVDIFTATAAFSAVMVVFVQNQQV